MGTQRYTACATVPQRSISDPVCLPSATLAVRLRYSIRAHTGPLTWLDRQHVGQTVVQQETAWADGRSLPTSPRAGRLPTLANRGYRRGCVEMRVYS